MGTYTQLIYQIVFSTRHRKKCLIKNEREKAFAYISGILKHKKCHPYIVNGVTDHLHIITHIHPTIGLSDLIKDIKISSNAFIKERLHLPDFDGWQNGYGAFSYSIEAVSNLYHYVERQEVHHGEITFEEEYIQMLEEHGIEYEPKYVFD